MHIVMPQQPTEQPPGLSKQPPSNQPEYACNLVTQLVF